MDFAQIVKLLEQWYLQNRRQLPWRENKDPYTIWLSEVILQQTRVAQGLPYFNRFIKRYPTVTQLANAPLDEILKLWEGLGYYSRARNLHAGANQVVKDFGGVFPSAYQDLLKIQGIGPYTAAAIASIAYNEQTAVLDGNVFRLLSRLFALDTPINTHAGKQQFQKLAQALITNTKNPGDYNQAIMEFGALQCTPKSPNCAICDLAKYCNAFAMGIVNALPVKEKSKPLKNRYLNYLICKNEHDIFIQQRHASDIWKGLYEFPLIETSNQITEPYQLMEHEHFKGIPKLIAGPIKHVLSHQRLWITFWLVPNLPSNLEKQAKSLAIAHLHKLAFPIVLKRFVDSNLLLLPPRLQ